MKQNRSLAYRRRLDDLVQKCRRGGISVRFVSGKSLYDYAGFNDEASKKLGFRRLPDDTVLIDKDMPVKMQYQNLMHEVEEMVRMEKLHWNYWRAHLAALRAERKGFSDFVWGQLKRGM
jgi:hypothetical protein